MKHYMTTVSEQNYTKKCNKSTCISVSEEKKQPKKHPYTAISKVITTLPTQLTFGLKGSVAISSL